MTPAQTLDWLAQQHFDQCREERPIQDWIRKMKVMLPTHPSGDVWMDGSPQKRGVYQVKRVGKATANRGFSYWNGERWGMLCSTRAIAMEIRDLGRKTPSRYPTQWLKRGKAC